MERNVIIDEVFGDDLLHLQDVINEYVNDEELDDHKLISVTTHNYNGLDGREFVGARLSFVKTMY
ncbi:MAG: hypothetical protein L0K90_08235 [Staphylococcus equorum]|nr:hypothetical protein [Staphylococcus equorum]